MRSALSAASMGIISPAFFSNNFLLSETRSRSHPFGLLTCADDSRSSAKESYSPTERRLALDRGLVGPEDGFLR
jgi:hypothetical protein